MPRLEIQQFLSHKLKKFGVSPRAVDWGSRESQIKRFEILLSLVDVNNKIVVDAGCGFGDLYLFMIKNGKNPLKYIGIEVHPEIAKIAAQNTNQDILVLDVLSDQEKLPAADIYLASGSLNYLTYSETYTFIECCFKKSREAFVFNILSTHADYMEKGYNYFSPSELLAFCMRMTRKVTLKHDYMPHDFTIAMYKT